MVGLADFMCPLRTENVLDWPCKRKSAVPENQTPNDLIRDRTVYMAKETRVFSDPRVCPGWQPARKVGPEHYSCMDLNPTIKKALKGISFPNQKHASPQPSQNAISALPYPEQNPAVPRGLNS